MDGLMYDWQDIWMYAWTDGLMGGPGSTAILVQHFMGSLASCADWDRSFFFAPLSSLCPIPLQPRPRLNA
jgi:hypothetical protein